MFLVASLLTLSPTEPVAQYPGWQHSGSMFILTTPEGANLPASAVVKDFPVLVRLNKDFFDFSKAKADGADLRFSTKNGEPLAYQIEEWDAANGTAIIWVRVPTIQGDARQEIKIYWCNTAAISESSGSAVFNAANNFAAVLHMNETVHDEVGTITAIDAGTTLSTGVIGKSRAFSAGKGVHCGTEIKTFPSGSTPHSSEAWFKAKMINTTVLAWGVPTDASKVVMNLASPAHMSMDCWFGGANVAGAITIPMSEWVHVVHAYDGKKAKLYVNGVLDNTDGSDNMKIPNTVSMYIGGWNQVADTYDFVGEIDEVRISKVARSADWIRLQYENQKPMQTLVGPLVQPGNDFSLSSESTVVNESQNAEFIAKAGGAQKLYWILKRDGREEVVATDRFRFAFDAGRVSNDAKATLQCKAVYADGVKTKDIAITIKETIPEPIFTLKAPAKWDGRSTIEVVPQIKNLAAMQAANAADLKFEWSAEPFAIIKEVAPGKLRLLRSQNSGDLTVTAKVGNGGKPVTQSVDIMVTEPKKDAWVQRIPAKDEKPEDGQFYTRDDKGLGTLYYNGTLTAAAATVFLKLYANDKLIKTETAKPAADKSYTLLSDERSRSVKRNVRMRHLTPITTRMKHCTISLIALLSAVLTLSSATAQQEPGKDITVIPAIAEGLSLHNLFQSNMVLQREKPITIWGWAEPGEDVSVSFGGQTQTTKAGADRSWKVSLQAMPATAEPLQMAIKGKDATITLDNILMGDVWVMGGQSNMQEPLRNLEGGDVEIASANFPRIRLLTVPSIIDNKEKKHPELKIPAAERIARWAMATQYGVNSVNWKPPMITKMETKDNTLILNFDSDVSSVDSQAIAGFSIAGKDGKFQPAKAEYLVTGKNNNGQPQHNWKALVLSRPLVPNPIHFRFAWGRNPMGNLRMVYIKDIPLGTQRSDNWTVADMYENYTGKKSAVSGLVNGGEVEELRKALKAADLERRIFEAQALLEAQKK